MPPSNGTSREPCGSFAPPSHLSEPVRRRLTAAAAALLGLLLLARNRPAELGERLRFISRYASRELAVRRLGGSSTAFDRRFFIFLEAARRTMPPGSPGIALFVPRPSDAELHLASYTLAPTPVLLSPRTVPAGWIAAIYGPLRPSGWILLAPLPDGALMSPGPARRDPGEDP